MNLVGEKSLQKVIESYKEVYTMCKIRGESPWTVRGYCEPWPLGNISERLNQEPVKIEINVEK